MRTIKELLILLREQMLIQFGPIHDGCICYITANMQGDGMIDDEEYDKLEGYIDDHRPSETMGNVAFWWPYGELAPRLEFLDKLIAEYDETV